MMTAEEQKIYDEYLVMFGTPAWKKFMNTVETYKQNIVNATPYKIDSELGLGEVRGSIQAFDMVLNLEATMTNNQEQEEPVEEE